VITFWKLEDLSGTDFACAENASASKRMTSNDASRRAPLLGGQVRLSNTKKSASADMHEARNVLPCYDSVNSNSLLLNLAARCVRATIPNGRFSSSSTTSAILFSSFISWTTECTV
jgi:hypothetical protein